MFVTRGESEFEVTIRAVDDEWEGKIVEHWAEVSMMELLQQIGALPMLG